jgi:hypothetical protein
MKPWYKQKRRFFEALLPAFDKKPKLFTPDLIYA